jgi:hypothetical protein
VVVKTREAHTPWLKISSVPSRLSTSTNGSLIQRSVSLKSHLVYYWATLSAMMAYAPTRQR